MKKRIFSIILCVVLIFTLSSCGKNASSNESSNGDYYDGYVEGYNDGIAKAQNAISDYTTERFNDINMSVEDAIQILTNYADGEPISDEELHNAIWLVHTFYYEAWDIVWEIDDCTID